MNTLDYQTKSTNRRDAQLGVSTLSGDEKLSIITVALMMAICFSGCKKNGDDAPVPPAPPVAQAVYKGAEVKSVSWGAPVVTATDGVRFAYTGSAVLTLTFETDGKASTKDTTVSLNAVATAKAGTVANKVVLEEGETPGTPTYAVVSKNATATAYKENIELRFNGGKFVVPLALSSDSVSVTVRGKKIPLSFGHGNITSNGLELGTAAPVEEGGQKYQKQALTVKATFAHPQQSASQQLSVPSEVW
ncbi:MAG: hypothetical protein LBN37_06335, partial [Bacteroidales bacterium]|nr:hypothetical protein [Bacteroidales bacterium]